jgi:hypothetical protein
VKVHVRTAHIGAKVGVCAAQSSKSAIVREAVLDAKHNPQFSYTPRYTKTSAFQEKDLKNIDAPVY